MLGQLVVHSTGEHRHRGMHAEGLALSACRPQVDLCTVPLDALDAGRGIQKGTACDHVSGQRPVKGSFIDDVGQGLLRSIRELSSMA
jgi:hypothetical protein